MPNLQKISWNFDEIRYNLSFEIKSYQINLELKRNLTQNFINKTKNNTENTCLINYPRCWITYANQSKLTWVFIAISIVLIH